MTLPANQVLTNATLLQSKVNDLERRLAVLEQYLQTTQDGGLAIIASRGSVIIRADGGNVAIFGAVAANVTGVRGVGLVSGAGPISGMATEFNVKALQNRITMNVAPTIADYTAAWG
jgi:hypothetical protein